MQAAEPQRVTLVLVVPRGLVAAHQREWSAQAAQVAREVLVAKAEIPEWQDKDSSQAEQVDQAEIPEWQGKDSSRAEQVDQAEIPEWQGKDSSREDQADQEQREECHPVGLEWQARELAKAQPVAQV